MREILGTFGRREAQLGTTGLPDFSKDSFFTLSGTGQAGLLTLSVLMAALMLAMTRKICTGKKTVNRLGLAAILFVFFLWLSPQVYYSYYQLIIPGLPWQIVIKSPIERLISLHFRPTLAQLGQAILFLMMLLVAFTAREYNRRD